MMQIRYQEKFNKLPELSKSLLFWLACFAFMGLGLLVSQFVPKEWFWYSWGCIGTLNVLLASKIFLKFEHQKLKDIGLFFDSGTIMRFITGIVIGGVMMGSVIVLLIHFAGLRLSNVEHANPITVLLWSLALVPAALLEEIAFRAYTLKRLQTAYRLLTSQMIIAIAFAVYHLIGGMGWIDALVGTGIWSIVFGLAAVWSNGIALPTGIHAASNMVQAWLGLKGGFPALETIVPDSTAGNHSAQYMQWLALSLQVSIAVIPIVVFSVLIKRKAGRPGAANVNS